MTPPSPDTLLDELPSVEVPVELAPGFVPFVLFNKPHILLDLPPTETIYAFGTFICLTTPDHLERQRELKKKGLGHAAPRSDIPLALFLRVLAKIAHSFVVSQVGLDRFRPLLTDVILGKDTCVAYYIGSVVNDFPNVVAKPQKGQTHQIFPITLTIKGVDYIAVEICLFSNLEPPPPVYLAIVGEYSGPKSNPHPVFL